MGLTLKTRPSITATDLSNWVFDACMVAQMRTTGANKFIHEEAKLARQGWAKNADKTTRDFLKLLQHAKHAAKALRESLDEADFEAEAGNMA